MKRALYVDTMIGTVGDGQMEKSHGGGKNYPGACVDSFMSRTNRYNENYNELLQFMAPRKSNGEFVFEQDRYDDDDKIAETKASVFEKYLEKSGNIVE